MPRNFKRNTFQKFLKKNRAIEKDLSLIRTWAVTDVDEEEMKDEIQRRKEHVRRFGEVFETARMIEKLEKLPAKLGLISLALGFFSFFSSDFAIKVIFIVVLVLLAVAVGLTWIIKRDYRDQLAQQLGAALSFSEEFKTASVNDYVIYNYARAKL